MLIDTNHFQTFSERAPLGEGRGIPPACSPPPGTNENLVPTGTCEKVFASFWYTVYLFEPYEYVHYVDKDRFS